MPKELSDRDCGRFYRLIYYIIGDNQLLGYRGNRGVKPLTVEKIAKIINCTERQAKIYIRKMNKLGIIRGVQTGLDSWYMINPLYALKGKYLTEMTFCVFKDKLMGELPDYVIKEWLENGSK